jgi:hypothetical protein
MPAQTSDKPVATRVPEGERLAFLPMIFGARNMLRGEDLVYGWMSHLCSSYEGGYWEFFTVPGSGFMAPLGEPDKKFHLSWAGNGFTGEASAEAAGIIATLYALNQLANETGDDALIERYYALRDFARGHAEAELIFAAID